MSVSVGSFRPVHDDPTDHDDTDSDVKEGSRAQEPSLTSIVMSAGVISSDLPPHPDPVLSARGLPDFSAMLAAELAAAADTERAQASSPLGVGEVVLSARELTGLSQRALASRAGTTQAAVTAIETGNRLPTIRLLMRLVEAAGLELVVGLRRPGASVPTALGALVTNAGDGLPTTSRSGASRRSRGRRTVRRSRRGEP